MPSAHSTTWQHPATCPGPHSSLLEEPGSGDARSRRGTDAWFLGRPGPRRHTCLQSLFPQADQVPHPGRSRPKGGASLSSRARVAAGDLVGCKEVFLPKPEKPAGQPGPGLRGAGAPGAGGARGRAGGLPTWLRRALPGGTCSQRLHPVLSLENESSDSQASCLLPLPTAPLSQAPRSEGAHSPFPALLSSAELAILQTGTQ